MVFHAKRNELNAMACSRREDANEETQNKEMMEEDHSVELRRQMGWSIFYSQKIKKRRK